MRSQQPSKQSKQAEDSPDPNILKRRYPNCWTTAAMLERLVLPSLFLGSLVSILMQLACMWPVANLSRDLNLSVHRVLYASAGGLFLSNAIAMPLMGRCTVQSQSSLHVCFAVATASGALTSGSAAILTVATATKAFFAARLSAMGPQQLQDTVTRYLDGVAVLNCVAWRGCPNEIAGHMRVLLLSAAFYNALACLLLVSNACLIARAQFIHSWLMEDATAAVAAAAADYANSSNPLTEATAAAVVGGASPAAATLSPAPSERAAATGVAQLPISPVWISLQ